MIDLRVLNSVCNIPPVRHKPPVDQSLNHWEKCISSRINHKNNEWTLHNHFTVSRLFDLLERFAKNDANVRSASNWAFFCHFSVTSMRFTSVRGHNFSFLWFQAVVVNSVLSYCAAFDDTVTNLCLIAITVVLLCIWELFGMQFQKGYYGMCSKKYIT